MNRRNILAMLTMVAVLLLGAGCGGAPTTTVVLTLSTVGSLPNGTLIGGSDVNIILPTSVSVKAATNVSPGSSSGIVTVSGVATNTNAMSIATQTAANTLNVKVVNPHGFGVGEFATVTLDIDMGAKVTASDFSTTGFMPVDLDGAPIKGLGVVALIQ